MRQDQHDRALVGQLADRRHGGAQPRVVGHLPVSEGNVQVLADEYALSADVTDIVERPE